MTDQLAPNTIVFTEDRQKARGWIVTAWCDFEFEAVHNEAANTDDRQPRYRVMGRSPKGTPVEIGAIWERRSQDNGRTYLSIGIRDTGLEGREFNGNIARRPGPNTSDADLVQSIIASRSRSSDRDAA